MATTSSVISAASTKIGVESPTDAQNAQALVSLNNMLTLWGADFLDYAVVSSSVAIGTGGAEYTVGSGGDLDEARPLIVNSCYIRNSDGHDFFLEPMSSEEYNSILDKDASMRPTKYYFLPEYTLSKVIFNSVPDATYTAYFEFSKNFSVYATVSTTTTITLPPAYLGPLVDNLAVSLSEDWDRKVKPTLYKRAEEGKDIVSALAASTKTVSSARFEFNGGVYNITNDSWGR